MSPGKIGDLILGVREPMVKPETPIREAPSASFGDLVRMVGEGIADAQMRLDLASAELVQELASTYVEIVPEVTEVIDAEGNVTYESGKPQNSLY